jgi:hypothetical protein
MNFPFQYSVRVPGIDAFRHPGCRCQKHPWTSTTARSRGNTMSGVPGKSVRWSLNLKPSAWAALRTAISGVVSRERTRDIKYDRRAGVSRSMQKSSCPQPRVGHRTRAECATSALWISFGGRTRADCPGRSGRGSVATLFPTERDLTERRAPHPSGPHCFPFGVRECVRRLPARRIAND